MGWCQTSKALTPTINNQSTDHHSSSPTSRKAAKLTLGGSTHVANTQVDRWPLSASSRKCQSRHQQESLRIKMIEKKQANNGRHSLIKWEVLRPCFPSGIFSGKSLTWMRWVVTGLKHGGRAWGSMCVGTFLAVVLVTEGTLRAHPVYSPIGTGLYQLALSECWTPCLGYKE